MQPNTLYIPAPSSSSTPPPSSLHTSPTLPRSDVRIEISPSQGCLEPISQCAMRVRKALYHGIHATGISARTLVLGTTSLFSLFAVNNVILAASGRGETPIDQIVDAVIPEKLQITLVCFYAGFVLPGAAKAGQLLSTAMQSCPKWVIRVAQGAVYLYAFKLFAEAEYGSVKALLGVEEPYEYNGNQILEIIMGISANILAWLGAIRSIQFIYDTEQILKEQLLKAQADKIK